MGTERTVFFTIVARNYLPFAAVLARSLSRHHPDAEVCVWLLDEGDYPDMACRARYRNVREAFAPDDLAGLRIYYDVLELATAVKPRLIEMHLAEGADRVIYMDPDIAVFRPMDEVFEQLAQGASVVLTPHLTQPLPRDGRKPDDLEILTSGTYNLGFLAVAACSEVRPFLSWWKQWLRTHCLANKAQGVFTDQKWVEFAPSLLRQVHVLADPSYNVAYWNLHYRTLARSGSGWSVNGRPLCFYHFSGIDPERPNVLSKHQDRFDLENYPALQELFASYASEVLGADYREIRRQYPFCGPRFSNGVAVDVVVRHLYRQLLMQNQAFDEPLDANRPFYRWLLRSLNLGDGEAITNYLRGLYDLRPDVGRAFPDLLGAHRAAFLSWATRAGIAEMRLSPELVAGRRERARPAAGTTASVPSPARLVNYIGYVGARLGLGEAARGNIRALEAHGISVHTHDVSGLTQSAVGEWTEEPADRPGHAVAEVNIIHANADTVPEIVKNIGVRHLLRGYNIGIWAWETLDFPKEWLDRFAFLDEIWVGGSFMSKSIAEVSPVPVVHIPHVVEVPDVQPDRPRFGIRNDETVFLFMFDLFSTCARKNPEAVIEAFRRAAFDADAPVRLIIKSMNGSRRPDAMDRLQRLATGLRVTFLDEALSGNDRFVLLKSCNAFVSLHRAEGFGLGMAEAMAMGKPVIATGWSGNMDFMDINNSLPVAFELKRLTREEPPYCAGTLWAEPDVDHAAQLMRRVVDDRASITLLCERAKHDIEKRFGSRVIGEKMVARLERIAAFRRDRAATSRAFSERSTSADTALRRIVGSSRESLMETGYGLFKARLRGQVSWGELAAAMGGLGRTIQFILRLPSFLMLRTSRRWKRSLLKRTAWRVKERGERQQLSLPDRISPTRPDEEQSGRGPRELGRSDSERGLHLE